MTQILWVCLFTPQLIQISALPFFWSLLSYINEVQPFMQTFHIKILPDKVGIMAGEPGEDLNEFQP